MKTLLNHANKLMAKLGLKSKPAKACKKTCKPACKKMAKKKK